MCEYSHSPHTYLYTGVESMQTEWSMRAASHKGIQPLDPLSVPMVTTALVVTIIPPL